jgi:hypothetical protein
MGATHDTNITINISLEAAPPTLFGFNVMVVGESAMSDRVRSYASAGEVDADSDLSTAQKDALKVAFAQVPRPGLVKFGKKVGGGSPESWTDALTAIEAADPNWYGLAIESRTSADLVAAAGWVETRTKLFVGQSADSGWLTTGVPAAFSTITSNERTAIIFHDEATEYADIAWLAARLVFDPDTFSVPWDTQIRGVAAYTSALTTGQRGFVLENNANAMLPYGSVETFVDPGVNISGRTIDEIVTADWFKLRLESKIAQAKINASARGEKIPLGRVGVSILRPLVEAQFSEGIAAGHFVEGQTEVTFIAPTQTDIDNRRIRATGRAQLTVGARIFDFAFNFQRSAITEEAA